MNELNGIGRNSSILFFKEIGNQRFLVKNSRIIDMELTIIHTYTLNISYSGFSRGSSFIPKPRGDLKNPEGMTCPRALHAQAICQIPDKARGSVEDTGRRKPE